MDSTTISSGLKKFSSDDWQARLFLVKPGHSMTREMAPELRHAGLYAPLGLAGSAPAPMPRHMPLFGEVHPFEDTRPTGAMFLTTSKDNLTLNEISMLSDLIFETSLWKCFKNFPQRVQEMEGHFRSLINFEEAWLWGTRKMSQEIPESKVLLQSRPASAR